MSQTNYYRLCSQHMGKKARITCHDGKVHTGTITRVTRSHVWIRPSGGFGGFGYGFFGGYGYGYGYGYPIALGAIAGFALASALFLW
ncbi:hypothetical protein [Domibacillus robiginosus]|uniref:hypothetical protein n=1 Tax=Domibacillus robiginosus TaxID=1071054 RepID=UPI00067DBD8D|nr:hypothetical protein [Domibacillus robiginosus]